MAEIIISLRHVYQGKEMDLEVSNDQIIRECIDFVALREGWVTPNLLSSLAYIVEAVPGNNLPLDLTFEQASVWNGAELIFHPPGGKPQTKYRENQVAPPQQSKENSGYKLIQLD